MDRAGYKLPRLFTGSREEVAELEGVIRMATAGELSVHSDEREIAERRDRAIRRALNTPPQPKHGKVKESKAGQPAPAAKPGKREQAGSGS